MRIPMFPAKAEKIAPEIKAGIISTLVVSTACAIPKSATDAPATKMAKSLYSAFKNAKAPSLMLLEIDCIFSFPSSCALTH